MPGFLADTTQYFPSRDSWQCICSESKACGQKHRSGLKFTKKRKVLVIAYFFPPAGGSPIQRTLKFVKYLREYGYEPIVLTTEINPDLNKYSIDRHTFVLKNMQSNADSTQVL